MNTEQRLREAGCECPQPLIGYRPKVGPRCRLCNTVARLKAKPCIMCGTELYDVFDNNWATNQPYKGGEVVFIFSYGSCKFDDNIGSTAFTGVICDDCAESCMARLERVER